MHCSLIYKLCDVFSSFSSHFFFLPNLDSSTLQRQQGCHSVFLFALQSNLLPRFPHFDDFHPRKLYRKLSGSRWNALFESEVQNLLQREKPLNRSNIHYSYRAFSFHSPKQRVNMFAVPPLAGTSTCWNLLWHRLSLSSLPQTEIVSNSLQHM